MSKPFGQHFVKFECLNLPVKYFTTDVRQSAVFAAAISRCCVTRSDCDSRLQLSSDSIVEQDGVPCMMCETTVDGVNFRDEMAEHLLLAHRVVVADIEKISCLSCYCRYWRTRFQGNTAATFCFSIQTDSSHLAGSDREGCYFLLSPKLEEDEQLRHYLYCQRLRRVLDQQRRERQVEDFSRCCLFCRDQISGSLYLFFDHLIQKHNFSIGRPQNLVFVEELICKIDDKLNSLVCVFCDGQFKDRAILKEHMRKKGHKTLDPNNKSYDRYYVVNYLERGKSWRDLSHERRERYEPSDDEACDEDWSDWKEDSVMGMVCLMCSHCEQDYDHLVQHMQGEHRFCLPSLLQQHCNSFYSQVRLINYIRHCVLEHRCLYCSKIFDSDKLLLDHMNVEDHLQLPAASVWHQPQYLFPVFENDLLLQTLVDERDDEEEHGVTVIAEPPLTLTDSILLDSRLLSQLREEASNS